MPVSYLKCLSILEPFLLLFFRIEIAKPEAMKRRLSQWICLLWLLPALGLAQESDQRSAPLGTQSGSISSSPTQPVSFAAFEVQPGFPGYWVHWELTHERPIRYVYVERSSDGGRFALSGGMMAMPEQLTYDFVDVLPENGAETFDYRLEILYADGSKEYSPTYRIYPNADQKLQVYPTPAKDFIWVHLPEAPCEGCTLTLLAENGTALSTQPTPEFGRMKLETSHLRPGKYVLMIKGANRQSWLGRLIKE
jgi:hypothetical protein